MKKLYQLICNRLNTFQQRSRILNRHSKLGSSLSSIHHHHHGCFAIGVRNELCHQKANYSTEKNNVIPLTSERYPHLKRNPNFKKLERNDVDYFQSVLDFQGGVLYSCSSSSSDLVHDENQTKKQQDLSLDTYNMDWMRKYKGQSQLVLRPKTTDQVSKILSYCNENRLAVVPQGGNTGLVGGSVPVFDEVIISMEKMNEIISFDSVSGTVVCQAGVILEKLDNWLAERDHMCPLDLGAKGSCHIGGNVATNAGGLRLLRYGSLHGTVLGLEAVLPDGTILNSLSTLRKDNTGLDLKQLFIGSEGSLGIITSVALLTPRKSKSVNVAMLTVSSYEAVQKVFQKSKSGLGEILSAFEFWDERAHQLVLNHMTQIRNPFQDTPVKKDNHFYILMETQGSNREHDTEKLNLFLEFVMEEELAIDGVVAQDGTQALNMWSIREGISEACSKQGMIYKYDISLPVPVLYQMVSDIKSRLIEAGFYCEEDAKNTLVQDVLGYGHIGDGNLHLNITAKEYNKDLTGLIEPYVYEWAKKYQGSISAEHGLGLMKAPYVGYSKSPEMIEMMRKVKLLFDPKGIMNPYKYLPEK